MLRVQLYVRMFYAKVCINTCYFLFWKPLKDQNCDPLKPRPIESRKERSAMGLDFASIAAQSPHVKVWHTHQYNVVRSLQSDTPKFIDFKRNFHFFVFFPQVSSKAPEFMSPNVWRKPQEQQPSSAELNHDSDSEDDCQIIGEEPRKSKSTSMHNMFLAMFLLFQDDTQ